MSARTFKDRFGRPVIITMTDDAVIAIRDGYGVDLRAGCEALGKILGSMELLGNVLYMVAGQSIDGRQVSPEEFAKALYTPDLKYLSRAGRVFVEAVCDLMPSTFNRKRIRRIANTRR